MLRAYALLVCIAATHDFSGHAPSILIARRMIAGPMAQFFPPSMDPAFLESIFNEKALPIVEDTRKTGRPLFNNMPLMRPRTIVERVKDRAPEPRNMPSNMYAHPLRIRISRFGFSKDEQAEASSNRLSHVPVAPSGGHPVLKFILGTAMLVGVAAVGYCFGKKAESRNYVRVPLTN